jgi:general nucleoside transport system ATP-binding protein
MKDHVERPGDAGTPLLSMRGISVAYGALRANDGIDLDVGAGEVQALLGENGAGKTTLMKALVGLAPIEGGSIEFDGKDISDISPLVARNAGIGMVHQHFMLIPTLTVAQNLCIGLRSEGYPFPNYRKITAKISGLSERYALKVDPSARVADLSVGEQQRVEIIKALYRGARLLVLDEPTSVLIPQEIEGLFEIIRNLSAQGTAVIFISHKLNEVMSISRNITILRRGKVAATRRTSETSAKELARLMVGYEMGDLPAAPAISESSPPVARIEGLRFVDSRKVKKLNGVDIEVRAGEIHGIAGVDGNGQVELARILAGILAASSGTIWLDGKDITRLDVARRIRSGLSYIPGDRQRTGLVMDLSVRDNMTLKLSDRPPYAVHGFLDFGKIRAMVEESIRDYNIDCADSGQEARTLSGGNQQKLVLSRELRSDPRLIVAVQPTQGLDISATNYVHSMLLERQRKGCAILLISTELDEVLSLSNRISVMYEGRLMGTFDRDSADRETIGLLMAGKQHA